MRLFPWAVCGDDSRYLPLISDNLGIHCPVGILLPSEGTPGSFFSSSQKSRILLARIVKLSLQIHFRNSVMIFVKDKNIAAVNSGLRIPPVRSGAGFRGACRKTLGAEPAEGFLIPSPAPSSAGYSPGGKLHGGSVQSPRAGTAGQILTGSAAPRQAAQTPS